MILRTSTQDGGAFVVLIGPDGTGKTTLAHALADSYRGSTRYFHFRPPLMATMPASPSSQTPPVSKIPRRRTGDVPLGFLRLGRTVVHCTIAYWVRIRPAVRRGELVIGDRWIFGYLTQPLPLRYYGPQWLARLALRIVPKPSLTVNLTAPVEVIRSRKRELTPEEIRSELRENSSLDVERLVTLSADQAPDALAASVLSAAGLMDSSSTTLETEGPSGNHQR